MLRGASHAWRDVIIAGRPTEHEDEDEHLAEDASKPLDAVAVLGWFTRRAG